MVNESVKTIGVQTNPKIEWKDQCECIKHKMQVNIIKLTRTDVKVRQARIYFNM